MNAAAMNNILTFLQGLSMTASNKRWLAEHLIEAANTQKKESVMSDNEVKNGLKKAFIQLNEVKKGKRKTRDVKELLNEL